MTDEGTQTTELEDLRSRLGCAVEIDRLAHEISDLLNASYEPGADRELILWRRLTKVSEEAGEVQDALRGWVGENPRKGITHTRSDVITELLDCAGAALGSVAHLLTDDEPSITDLLRERLEFVAGHLRPTPKVARCGECRLGLGGPHQATDPQCITHATKEADRG